MIINFSSKRYSKQSSLTVLKMMKASVNVLFKNGYLLGVKVIIQRLVYSTAVTNIIHRQRMVT